MILLEPSYLQAKLSQLSPPLLVWQMLPSFNHIHDSLLVLLQYIPCLYLVHEHIHAVVQRVCYWSPNVLLS